LFARAILKIHEQGFDIYNHEDRFNNYNGYSKPEWYFYAKTAKQLIKL